MTEVLKRFRVTEARLDAVWLKRYRTEMRRTAKLQCRRYAEALKDGMTTAEARAACNFYALFWPSRWCSRCRATRLLACEARERKVRG